MALDVLTAVGLVSVVVASFLPWVRSGRSSRNGYAAGGVLRRLLGVDAVAGFALTLLPFAALACAVSVVLLVVGHGLERPVFAVAGRVVAVLVAIGAVSGAAAALSAEPGYGITVPSSAPALAIAGAAAVVLAVIMSVGRSFARG